MVNNSDRKRKDYEEKMKRKEADRDERKKQKKEGGSSGSGVKRRGGDIEEREVEDKEEEEGMRGDTTTTTTTTTTESEAAARREGRAESAGERAEGVGASASRADDADIVTARDAKMTEAAEVGINRSIWRRFERRRKDGEQIWADIEDEAPDDFTEQSFKEEVFEDLKKEICEVGKEMNEEIMKEEEEREEMCSWAWDDVNDEELNLTDVRKGRKEEVTYMIERGIWKEVDES